MGKRAVFGFIGSGMIAEMHINNIIADGRGEIKWLCDVNEQALKLKMDKFGIPNGTADYKEILADEEVTCIIICTPPHTHVKFLFECLDAGKNVLVEKPLCIDKAELPLIVEKVAEHPNQVVMEASARYTELNPKAKFIKKMIDDGKLGDIYYVHQSSVVRQSRPGIEYNPGAYWFLDKAKAGGGPLLDWGVYDLALIFYLVGGQPELKDLVCFKQNGLDKVPHGDGPFTVEEHGVALMEFESGLKYYYERTTNAHNEVPSQIRIYGTKGGVTFSFEPWLTDEVEYYYVDNDGAGKAQKETLKVGYENNPTQEFSLIQHFVDCVVDDAENLMPVSKSAKKMEVLLELLK